MSPQIEPFDGRRHAVGGFSSGRPALDERLRRYAGQGQRRDLTRTFVIADSTGAVYGYYTLVGAEVKRADATTSVARGASQRFPIPVCLLARLAVDQAHQGTRVGVLLLLDSFRRALAVSEHVGMRAVVVDALDATAAGFYGRFGFTAVAREPLRMQITMEDIRRVLGSQEWPGGRR